MLTKPVHVGVGAADFLMVGAVLAGQQCVAFPLHLHVKNIAQVVFAFYMCTAKKRIWIAFPEGCTGVRMFKPFLSFFSLALELLTLSCFS